MSLLNKDIFHTGYTNFKLQKEFLKETSLMFGVGYPVPAKEGHENQHWR